LLAEHGTGSGEDVAGTSFDKCRGVMGASICHPDEKSQGPGQLANVLGDKALKCVGRCDGTVPCGLGGEQERYRTSREEELIGNWTKLELGLLAGATNRCPRPLPLLVPGGMVTHFGGAPLEPAEPADVYELKAWPIGFGSFSEVHLARHRRTRVLRAVKRKKKADGRCIVADTDEVQKHPSREPSRRRRDEAQEVEVLLRLDHPNVAKLYEVFECQDDLYLVMELLQGGSLAELLLPNHRSPRAKAVQSWAAREDPQEPQAGEEVAGSIEGRVGLPEHEACRLFWQMLSGILHLHGHGVMHRDIKLEHFIFSSSDKTQAQLKLVDFGHAWPLQVLYGADGRMVHELTIPGGVGTNHFIAPEVRDDSEVVAHMADRADIWSLGICLHAMLTGRLLPCRTSGISKASQLKQRGSAVPQEAIVLCDEESLSPFAQDLLQSLLQMLPEDRPTAEQVARHPWLAAAMDADLSHANTMPRFIGDLSIVAEIKAMRRLFFLAIARELEDSETLSLRPVFRAMEVQCGGPLTEQSISAAVQRMEKFSKPMPSQELVLQLMKALLCVLPAINCDGSGVLGWSEALAVVLLLETQEGVRSWMLGPWQDSAADRACIQAFDKLAMGEMRITVNSLRRMRTWARVKPRERLEEPEDMFTELGWEVGPGLSRRDFLCILHELPQPEPLTDTSEPPEPLPTPSRLEEEFPRRSSLGSTEEYVWDGPSP